MAKLILMRHGESVWNKKNLFTGWVDVPLTQKGIDEAVEGGKKIKDIPIDVIFTSTMIRAQMTLFLAMLQHSSQKVPVFIHEDDPRLRDWETIYSKETKDQTIPIYHSWALNERMYGELQGYNKQAMAEKYGKDLVHTWRRSYDVPPPNGESLKDTADRTIPYFREKIIPVLEEGRNVFVPAHGNSLRSIVMFLDNLSKEEVLKLELKTGAPILYEYENGKWIKES